MEIDRKSTEKARARYNRTACFYDIIEAPIEWGRFSAWRKRLLTKIEGHHVLEIGVGTGKNFSHYPPEIRAAGIDFSPKMLANAKKRAAQLGLKIELIEMDVQRLTFSKDSFDTVFASFVFCSVPNPILGLQELKRVCKPNGKLLLLEHMRPGNKIAGKLFDWFNPVAVRISGANINRRTMENIKQAGWRIHYAENISSGIVWLVEASIG